ncbi:hypothetical protein ASE82_17610 [Sphingomonas sp. Leaf230]|uniref:hypothetical protein n=1 Tax=Sphingomonas sp. Leaf230 TaxID=1735694 RepID=UPI0006FE183F|nr:hypothetical protein [Sphingomonas sp. Leaf230]KQN00171.1 hypothetical protein ASE82_17610 [Sphingomonas sp. Leaf230]
MLEQSRSRQRIPACSSKGTAGVARSASPAAAGADRRIADRCPVGQSDVMENEPSGFEQSAQIVEAFSESETDPRVLELLNAIAKAIRDHAIDN